MQNEEFTATLDRLRENHRLADERLKELAGHLSLSTDEQMELARLKKRKLHLKDEIRVLSAKLGSS
jgi:uncharacterized protein YdcH (DUF465 family)